MVQQWTCDVDWSGQQWICDVMMACVELQVTIMIDDDDVGGVC
jgi:hypothetical protein